MALSNNIIEIQEFTLTPGLTDIIYSTSGPLPNALIGIYCDKYGVYPADVRKENNSIHITYEAQSETIHVAMIMIKGDITINNTLVSTSETEALSAAQGKALKDLIDALTAPDIDELGGVDITEPAAGDVLVFDSVSETWKNTPMLTKISDLDDVTISSITNGQVLAWNSTSGKFENVNQSGGSSAQLIKKSWTATSSTASYTQLTESVSLDPGKYIINIRSPYSTSASSSAFCITLDDVVQYNTIETVPVSYGTYNIILEIASSCTMKYVTVSSTSLSWDNAYLDRGGVNILKLT